jgi:hypothetical protein
MKDPKAFPSLRPGRGRGQEIAGFCPHGLEIKKGTLWRARPYVEMIRQKSLRRIKAMYHSIAKLTFICALACAMAATGTIFFSMARIAEAQDMLVIDQENQTMLSGIIVEVDSNSFVLRSSETEIEVSMEELEFDGDADKLLAPGMEVTVEGEFDNNIFQAKRVVKIGDNNHL